MASGGKQGTLLEECRDAASAFVGLGPVDVVSARSNAALLTSFVGRRSEKPCQRLAARGDLRVIARLCPNELVELGFTRAEAARLEAFFELARRFGEERWAEGTTFRTSYDIYAHFRERLAEANVELFIAVLLDVKNHKLRDVLISQGSLTSSIVHPREVFLPAIRSSAAGVIFVHNHPSGDATPSPEDLLLTRRLRDVGDLIGIRVLDHIVIGKGRYVSFVDDGFW